MKELFSKFSVPSFFTAENFFKGAYLLFLLQDSGQGEELVKGEGCFKMFLSF
jgi:hypothetical protein